jgi:hypothetical protein
MESHTQILIFSRIPVVGGDRDSFLALKFLPKSVQSVGYDVSSRKYL